MRRSESTMSKKSVSFKPEPTVMEDSEDEMIGGQGQVERPKVESRASLHSENWDE